MYNFIPPSLLTALYIKLNISEEVSHTHFMWSLLQPPLCVPIYVLHQSKLQLPKIHFLFSPWHFKAVKRIFEIQE